MATKKWIGLNRERIHASSAKYRKNNKEKIAACKRKWCIRNKEYIKTYSSEYAKKRYLDGNMWIIKNKEKRKTYSRSWYIKNRETVIKKIRQRQKERMKDPVECQRLREINKERCRKYRLVEINRQKSIERNKKQMTECSASYIRNVLKSSINRAVVREIPELLISLVAAHIKLKREIKNGKRKRYNRPS